MLDPTKHRSLKMTVCVVGLLSCALHVATGETPDSVKQEAAIAKTKTLQFAFERAQWRAVLSWVAKETGMALYINELPPGTFTYSDPNLFTPDETIDRINLFLIAEGFTFVRSGKLLTLIRLDDPQSMKQLDAMADLVSVDKLKHRGPYEVVKCIFPLGNADSTTALSELSAIGLISQPVVLAGTNQLLITDTAGKLRTAERILASLNSPDRNRDLVRSFVLKHATAEEVLAVARPHLGIEADEMSGFDVSLSANVQGNKLFATGSKQSIDLLDSLVEVIDRPDEADPEDRILRSHPVSGENLRSVYDVLQTLLSDQSIRLSKDEDTNSIVALAPTETHEHIKNTIEELDGPDFEFAVIELKNLNPYAALTLLNELFDADAEESEWNWRRDRRRWRDDDEQDKDPPKIHADLQRKRLLVRGKPAQIEEIKRVIASLDAAPKHHDNVRILHGNGVRSESILDMAKEYWRGSNPVLLMPAGARTPSHSTERTTHPEPGAAAPGNRSGGSREGNSSERRSSPITQTTIETQLKATEDPHTLSSGRARERAGVIDETDGDSDPIRVQVTPHGIVLQSDDTEALDRFEDHLREMTRLGGQTDSAEPIVFYLKFATANEATRMLADLLDGARWLNSSSAGFLDGTESSPVSGGYWGSLLMSRDGATTTMTAGSATVVADARLNRLIVQGTSEDVALIESYLQVIDKDTSITSIETHGRARVLELRHANAAEVASVLREAYGSRIAGQQTARRNDERRERDRDDDERDREEDESRRRTPRPTRNREPEMTLAVHEASNSLIITAPRQLYEEVERLARAIDRRAEQATEVVVPLGLSGRGVANILQNALLENGADQPPRNSSERPAETSRTRRNRDRQ